jgi:hypothetical protein
MAQAEQQRADALRGPGEDFGPDLTAEGRIPAPGSGGAITDAPYLDDLRRGYAPGDAALYAQIDRLTRERDAVETKLRVALEGLHAASALLRAAEGERDVARAALQTAHDWIAGGVEYDAAQEAHWEVRARRALGKNP